MKDYIKLFKNTFKGINVNALNFDASIWTFRKTILFLAIFIMLYGVSAYGIDIFSQLYLNPLELLPEGSQWLHESPIQFFIGHFFFSSLNPKIAYVFVQLIGFSLLIGSYILLLKNRKIEHSELFLTLAMSPFFLVIFTWHGTPDLFLIASCFGMLATSERYQYLFPFYFFISVFSHPQITIFYVLFFIILNQLKPNTLLLFSLTFSYAIHFGYIQELGDFSNRMDFILEKSQRILGTLLRKPFFSLFCTFGWLWMPILFYRNLLTKRVIIVAIMCFGILLTVDHTRVFVFSIFLYWFTCLKKSLYQITLKKFQDFYQLVFITFSVPKAPGGDVLIQRGLLLAPINFKSRRFKLSINCCCK